MFLVAPLIIWKYQQAKARAWVTGADAWVTGLWLCGSILRIINSSRPAVTPAGSQPVPNMMRELVPNEAATHASLQCEVILMNLRAAKHKKPMQNKGARWSPRDSCKWLENFRKHVQGPDCEKQTVVSHTPSPTPSTAPHGLLEISPCLNFRKQKLCL